MPVLRRAFLRTDLTRRRTPIRDSVRAGAEGVSVSDSEEVTMAALDQEDLVLGLGCLPGVLLLVSLLEVAWSWSMVRRTGEVGVEGDDRRERGRWS